MCISNTNTTKRNVQYTDGDDGVKDRKIDVILDLILHNGAGSDSCTLLSHYCYKSLILRYTTYYNNISIFWPSPNPIIFIP